MNTEKHFKNGWSIDKLRGFIISIIFIAVALYLCKGEVWSLMVEFKSVDFPKLANVKKQNNKTTQTNTDLER